MSERWRFYVLTPVHFIFLVSISFELGTWPRQRFCVGDPMQPIFHLFVLGVGVGGNANFSVRVGGNANFSIFRYQHVSIPNGWPQRKNFASQWNIDLSLRCTQGVL